MDNKELEQEFKEFHRVRDALKNLQVELAAAEAKKKANDEILRIQEETFKATINQVAAEKLTWAQEKAAEEQELKSKKDEVDKILARSAELDKREGLLNDKDLKLAEDLKRNSAILLDIQRGKAENENVLKHAEKKFKEAEAIEIKVKKATDKVESTILNLSDKLIKTWQEETQII